MGRLPKPDAVLEASGAKKKNPQRYRDRGEAARPVGDVGPPPARFLRSGYMEADRKKQLWFELQQEVPPGVLTGSDRSLLEIACDMKYKLERGTIKPGELTMLEKCLGKMGCTPSDRTRITAKRAAEADKRNRFADFAATPMTPKVQ